jgi:hypothetical protein
MPDHAPIVLNDVAIQREHGDAVDKYEWAIVYENQRGQVSSSLADPFTAKIPDFSMTLFSIPYYSALSLLPTDPYAFTLPNASHKRSEQPPITLATYPLPDGNWRWVSRAWMIDMRSESGIIQHDGFEYNWVFRRHNWRAEVGFLSAGGWVRRRRWVRLMMRPAKNKLHADLEDSTSSGSVSSRINLLRHSMTSSSLTSLSDFQRATAETVWHGNEDDWWRCRSLMLHYARDGRKLDLWRIWLGYHHPAYQDLFRDPFDSGKGKRRQKQWTEDEGPLPSQLLEPDAASHRSMTPPPREYIIPVLHKHASIESHLVIFHTHELIQGRDLLQIFVYPESRVQFIKLLGKADLLSDLGVSIGPNFTASEVDFWSYTSGLSEELKRLDIKDAAPTPATSSSLLSLLTPQQPSAD